MVGGHAIVTVRKEVIVLDDTARSILSQPVFVHLAVDAGGRPHVSPVWVALDGDRILVNTATGRVKERALTVGAPVALSATAPDNPYQALVIQGRVVERRTEGADADIDALAKKYLDADTYPFRQEGEERVTVIIEPERVVAG